MTNPVCTYDFTVHAGDTGLDFEKTKDLLKKECKKWVFQEEICEETLAHHYQGRMSLKVKLRIGSVIQKFPGFHLSITSNENRDNAFYVMKIDTRHKGPWTSDDKQIYVPSHIKNIKNLFPWQQSIIDSAANKNLRDINILLDFIGGHGKSTLKSYINCHGIGLALPYAETFKDNSRMVMNKDKKPLYIIDIPRALQKKHMSQFFMGVEQLKDGYAYDDRYAFKDEYFEIPTVWIFTNKVPEIRYLSGDRWKFWMIDPITNDIKPLETDHKEVKRHIFGSDQEKIEFIMTEFKKGINGQSQDDFVEI